jgi:hypothetical protein
LRHKRRFVESGLAGDGRGMHFPLS